MGGPGGYNLVTPGYRPGAGGAGGAGERPPLHTSETNAARTLAEGLALIPGPQPLYPVSVTSGGSSKINPYVSAKEMATVKGGPTAAPVSIPSAARGVWLEEDADDDRRANPANPPPGPNNTGVGPLRARPACWCGPQGKCGLHRGPNDPPPSKRGGVAAQGPVAPVPKSTGGRPAPMLTNDPRTRVMPVVAEEVVTAYGAVSVGEQVVDLFTALRYCTMLKGAAGFGFLIKGSPVFFYVL